jgi:plastocyanin
MRHVTLAALSAVAVMAAAGCGGDGGSAVEESGTTSAATTGASGTGGGSEDGVLVGTVGPGFEISVDEPEVAAGTYSLQVSDESSSHNFHLTGPGVDVATDVGAEGPQTFTVELQPGTYTFVCDPHASSMNGTLTVR